MIFDKHINDVEYFDMAVRDDIAAIKVVDRYGNHHNFTISMIWGDRVEVEMIVDEPGHEGERAIDMPGPTE
jgi:hypothetical protein